MTRYLLSLIDVFKMGLDVGVCCAKVSN